jgi:hypothetical protein
MKEKKKSRFSGAVSSNAVKQKEKSNFGYLTLPEGVSMFKIDSGKSMFFDILPYEVTDKNHPDKKSIEQTDGLWYRRPFLVHSIPNGEHTDKVVCPTSFGKPCPICEYVKQMKDNGTSFEELKPFKAKERNLYVVIPYGHKEMEEKPYIWDDTQWYFQKMLNDELAENSDNECFPDLENGLMLKVRFSDDTYNNKPAPKPTRIDFKDREENGGQQYTEEILKTIPNLDEVLIVLSYKELEMKLSGIEDSDLDEPEENRDATKTLDRKKKTPFKDNDEDDEPVRKKKTARNLPPTPVYSYEEIQGMDLDELYVVAENTDIDISECNDDEDEIKAFLIIQLEIEVPKKSSRRGKPEPESEKKAKKKPEPVEDDEDDDDQQTTEDLINDTDDLDDLLEIADTYPGTFKSFKKDLLKIKKVKDLKNRMLLIIAGASREVDSDDLPFSEKPEANEIRIGSIVKHPKFGECEIVALNKKEATATLCDEDGERYVGIPCHKFNIISFGKPGDPGKFTKKEHEERQKPVKEYVKPAGKNKCPNGHIFGKDFEKFKDCSDCSKWDDCSDE